MIWHISWKSCLVRQAYDKSAHLLEAGLLIGQLTVFVICCSADNSPSCPEMETLQRPVERRSSRAGRQGRQNARMSLR
jgi:hypothetical protein